MNVRIHTNGRTYYTNWLERPDDDASDQVIALRTAMRTGQLIQCRIPVARGSTNYEDALVQFPLNPEPTIEVPL